MVVKTGRYGKFIACPGYPECKNIKKIINETGAECPKCGGLMVHKMGHGGGFDACIAEGCGYTTKQSKQDKKGSEE